jgi:ArsR family transcriptional regulator
MKTEASLFKALSDPTRLRLATLLAIKGEVCVCYLAGALEAQDFKVSRHLGILRAAGVVEARREGTWMHYKLASPRSEVERCLFDCFRRHLRSHPTVKADLKRLSRATCAVR